VYQLLKKDVHTVLEEGQILEEYFLQRGLLAESRLLLCQGDRETAFLAADHGSPQ
jgi:hypothetical protein